MQGGVVVDGAQLVSTRIRMLQRLLRSSKGSPLGPCYGPRYLLKRDLKYGPLFSLEESEACNRGLLSVDYELLWV